MRHLFLGYLFVSAFAPILAASNIILPSGLTVVPGQQVTFKVNLAQPAPPSGVFVSLTISDPSKVVLSASAVLINEGLLISRPVQITGISAGTASISATAFGLTGDVQTVTVGSSVGTITLPSAITLTASQSAVLPIAVWPPAPPVELPSVCLIATAARQRCLPRVRSFPPDRQRHRRNCKLQVLRPGSQVLALPRQAMRLRAQPFRFRQGEERLH